METKITKRQIEGEMKPFTPSALKSKVKERFYRRLKEKSHIIDKEAVFEDRRLLEELAGDVRIHDWLKSAHFARWWWDEFDIVDELMALRNTATHKLRDMFNDNEISHNDMLKAIRLLFEVTDQFPSRKQEVKFLDEELNKMSIDEADKEIDRLKGKLLIE